MDIFLNVLALIGVLALGAFPWIKQAFGKKTELENLQKENQETATELLLLSDRFTNTSTQFEENKQQLTDVKQQLQLSQTTIASLEQNLINKENLLVSRDEQAQLLNQTINTLREQDIQQKTKLAKLQEQHEQMLQSSVEKLAILEDAKTKLSLEFKELANRIFDEKQSKMTASSKETLDNIVKPMQKDMMEFRSRIEQVHKDDTEARTSLAHHLKDLKALNQQMSQDALNLTHALKGDSKAQGNWGEMILEKLLESSGLREGHEFEREKSFTNDEGKRQRPDVIINMPGDKQVIIDAKVSLTDYERAISSKDNLAKQQFTRAHVKSMQQHIQTLASKRYDHLEGVHSPDYVLMFMPIEGAYLMAIEADSSIFESAFDKRIAVVTPSTLYATLKLIEQLWRYERQSENVAKLINRAGSLHDKVVDFIKSFEDVGQRLGQAQASYHKAFGQIKTGRGSVISQIKTLGDLSGKAKKEIPTHLLEEDIQTPSLVEKTGDSE